MINPLAPIAPPFPDDISLALARYPDLDGYLLSLFRTFANSRRFLEKGVPFLLDKESPLPLRIREIVILRTTARNRCEYEWGVHAALFAKRAQLSPAQIAATLAACAEKAIWPALECRLIHAIDQLCDHAALDEPTAKKFQEDWTVEQQLEIFALCGAYHTVSFVANAAKLEPEPFAARFPAGTS